MTDDMLRPPVNRGMRALDKAFFQKTVPIAAARVFDVKQLSPCVVTLRSSKDLLDYRRVKGVLDDPDKELAKSGRKCLLLRPDIKHDDVSTWSEKLRDLKNADKIDVIPYDLKLDYDSWGYYDIITSILPEVEEEEVPSGFTITGHVAHLNLRKPYLPYKDIIGAVIVDKNPTVTTVINKIEDVGSENEYRTFQYEVLAGEDDLNVEVKEQDCLFRFDFAKVYWNSRLSGEHERLVSSFKRAEVICDVMAGVGPFAVPAGRKGVFVWANDLNPESYRYLKENVKGNKVQEFVRPSNADGRQYILDATAKLYHDSPQYTVNIPVKRSRGAPRKQPGDKDAIAQTITQPRFFSHFVMNLPASALSFLPSFVGLYTAACIPESADAILPKIHVHCFETKSEDNVEQGLRICAEISRLLGREMKPGRSNVEGEVEVVDVRDVAPKKRMFCASFTLPRDVAWARRN